MPVMSGSSIIGVTEVKKTTFKMRLGFKRVSFVVLGLYFMTTCYTGYMVIRKKFEKSESSSDAPNKRVRVPPDDPNWNPWGQEFEIENQKLPAFERPHLLLKPEHEKPLNDGNTRLTEPAGVAANSTTHVVEIWGKAAIGLYLWEHIIEGSLESRLGGIWSYGSQNVDNIEFRFRTGPGVVPGKVPHDTRNLVLVLNGREPNKIRFATMWLDYLPQLTQLVSVAVVLLGNEQCKNQWLHPYLQSHGGRIKAVFMVYDSPEVDDEIFYQWPLGVATYRKFPLFQPADVSASTKRPYLCNFLGTIYANSSRATLMTALRKTSLSSHCYVHARTEWLPNETDDSRDTYIRALTQSDLTLNPVGQNTECYRVYEALSLGSVPVVEDVMTSPGDCGGTSRRPLRLLKQYGAPFIYVTDWTRVGDLLQQEHQRPERDVVKRRDSVLRWYAEFRAKMKRRFVSILNRKFFGETS